MEIYITMDKLYNEEGVFTLKIYIVQFYKGATLIEL